MAEKRPHAAAYFGGGCRSFKEGTAKQFGVRWLRAGGPRLRVRSRGGIGVRVKQNAGDVHPRHSIHKAVMALTHDRETPAIEAVDEPKLPDRLAAVEPLGEDPSRDRAKLLLGSRFGQGRMSHVILNVELRIINPDGTALAERNEAKLLAKPGNQGQAHLNVPAKLPVSGGGAFEDQGRTHVHVRRTILNVEERRIESGQPVSRCHDLIFPDCAWKICCECVRSVTPVTHRTYVRSYPPGRS